MATTTRLLLRQYLSQDRHVGDWLTETTTSAGGAAGITLVCSALMGISQDTDYFLDWYAVLPAGPASAGGGTYEVRKVSGYTGSNGTVTVSGYRAFSAQVDAGASGVAFELHKYDPTKKHAALHAAGRLLAGEDIYLPVTEFLIVDNIATNPLFQTYSAAFTGWSDVSSPTIAEETSRILPGFSRSASIAASGAVEGLSQNLLTYANQDSIADKTLNVRGWLWCATGDSARLRVTFDGSTYYNSDYVSGSEEWEGPQAIRIQQAIPTTLSQMTLSVELASGVTGYCQMAAAWIASIRRYAVPSSIRFLDHLYQQVYDDRLDVWAPLGSPVAGRILKLEGRGVLTLPASDTATMEIGDWEIPLLVKLAAAELMGAVASEYTAGDKTEALGRSQAAMSEAQMLLGKKRYGQHVVWSNRGGAWHTQPEGSSLYLYLDR